MLPIHLLPNEMDAKQRFDDFLTKIGLRDYPKAGKPRNSPRNKLSNLGLWTYACPLEYINGKFPMMKRRRKVPNLRGEYEKYHRLELYPTTNWWMMKIVKDVVINATATDTWRWLTNDGTLPGLLNSAGESEKKRTENPLWPSSFIEVIPEPARKILLSAGSIPIVKTTLELSEQGKHTALKVTVTGWEGVDPDLARSTMPMVSLAWEKKLGILKKTIESTSKKRSKTG